jgi:hypothetical protein
MLNKIIFYIIILFLIYTLLNMFNDSPKPDNSYDYHKKGQYVF